MGRRGTVIVFVHVHKNVLEQGSFIFDLWDRYDSQHRILLLAEHQGIPGKVSHSRHSILSSHATLRGGGVDATRRRKRHCARQPHRLRLQRHAASGVVGLRARREPQSENRSSGDVCIAPAHPVERDDRQVRIHSAQGRMLSPQSRILELLQRYALPCEHGAHRTRLPGPLLAFRLLERYGLCLRVGVDLLSVLNRIVVVLVHRRHRPLFRVCRSVQTLSNEIGTEGLLDLYLLRWFEFRFHRKHGIL